SQEAAADLCTLWQNEATLGKVLRFSARKRLVLQSLKKFAQRPTLQKEVKLRISVASLPGRIDEYGGLRFEETYTYQAEDLCDAQRLDEISEVCVASAALPGLFRPRKAGHGGPYVDGGVVDNAPIGWALAEDEQVSCVVVVTPMANRVRTGNFGWLPLFRIVDMLSAERLHRELNQAKSVNERLNWLAERHVDLSALLEPELARHGVALNELRPVCRLQKLSFLEVRPAADLAGNLLTGFLSSQRRLEYIEAGRIAAAISLSRFQRSDLGALLSRSA
ncbi:MAG TPA: patatin-like phospholipase family protein, partial [Polyangiales bacterium]|nr:patatin-like phospholipase family protein [Polyangiales bacterium]